MQPNSPDADDTALWSGQCCRNRVVFFMWMCIITWGIKDSYYKRASSISEQVILHPCHTLFLLLPHQCKQPPASAALRIKGKYTEEKIYTSYQYKLLTHLWFWFRVGRRGKRGLPIPAPHSLSGTPAISACARQRKQSSAECTDWEALTSGWIDFSLSQTVFFSFFLSLFFFPWDNVLWSRLNALLLRRRHARWCCVNQTEQTQDPRYTAHIDELPHPTTSYRSALDPQGGATKNPAKGFYNHKKKM